ncbi:MAG: hypothetical protein ACI97A_002334 [Planctomycetota bacterium]|jgi:hypothetical protein
MSSKVLKILLGVLLIANLGYMAYQAYHYFSDVKDLKTQVKDSESHLVKIKERQLRYQRDLNNIVRNDLVTVENVTVALSRHAAAMGLRDDRDEINIPLKPKTDKGKVYDQDLWKLTFDRKKRFGARTLAKFARNVERDLPGYQIRVFDIGQRSETWGDDSWAPKEITVRRFKRREKK